jgi:hypothetical protein
MKPLISTEATLDAIGQAAYDAYCANRSWKSFNGDPLPKWPDVKPEIKAGWIAGASGVVVWLHTHCIRCGEFQHGKELPNPSLPAARTMCSTCSADYEFSSP